MICKIILMIISFSLHLFFAIIKLKLDYILILFFIYSIKHNIYKNYLCYNSIWLELNYIITLLTKIIKNILYICIFYVCKTKKKSNLVLFYLIKLRLSLYFFFNFFTLNTINWCPINFSIYIFIYFFNIHS